MEVDATEGSFIRLPLAQLEVAQPTVSFLKALPSQKLFLGEVSHNLPPQPVIVVVLLMFIMMLSLIHI